MSWFSHAALAAGWDYGNKLCDDEEVDSAPDEFELRMATDADDEDFVALQTEIEGKKMTVMNRPRCSHEGEFKPKPSSFARRNLEI
jgi:hypothetical protein